MLETDTNFCKVLGWKFHKTFHNNLEQKRGQSLLMDIVTFRDLIKIFSVFIFLEFEASICFQCCSHAVLGLELGSTTCSYFYTMLGSRPGFTIKEAIKLLIVLSLLNY